MWNSIREKIFPLVIALSALSVSASAAFYSVTGLSLLFAGASFAVIIMASSLEIAKLVTASLLYQYWEKLNKILRTYLTIAAFILILITSAGIYGFLSAAYQATANKAGIVENQIKLLETKKLSFEKIKGQYEVEKQSITQNITSLRNALGNNNQSYVDNNGNVISYSSSANRKSFEKQLEVAIQKDEQLTTKVQTYNDSIINLETRIVETQNNSEVAAELGPLKYLANLTGVSMDKIINWFLLVIIFVFDPLAIALVVAANFAFAQLIKKEDLIEEEIIDIPEKDWVEDWPSKNDKELEEANLVDLQTWEKQEEQEKPIPVFMDPKSGKLYYEEPEEKAAGGRIGYQNAGPVMPSAMPSNMPAPGIMSQAPESMDQEPTEPSISYDELRARLPSEITDDIVRLISESPQALEDFATIQTQQDVNNFNTKYGVNLTLPPEA